MVKNEAGEFYDLNLTICFLTPEKHSFGVHTDKSPKICTHVELRKLPRATTNVQKNKSYVGLFISYVGLFMSYVGLIKSYIGLYNSYVGDKIS